MGMGLNKKQKKQIEAARKKILGIRQRLAGAREQPDDPGEVQRLMQEIAAIEEQIKTIQQS